jgi:hypothetical protein
MARRFTGTGWMVLVGAAALALGLIGFGNVNAFAQRIAFVIATGPSSGTYFPVGQTIAGLISHPPGVDRCTHPSACGPAGLIASAQTSPGAYANVVAVESGRVDSALAQSDIVAQAVAGSGAFKKPQSHVRVIAGLFPEDVHLVVATRAHINDIAHLRRKRVSLGAVNSGTAVTARAVLSAFRVRAKTSNEPADLAAQKLQAGKLDAFFFVGGTPVPLVDSLVRSGAAKLLALDGKGRETLIAHVKGLSTATIPAGTYGNSPAVDTVSVQALWIVNDQVSNDVVYGVTRALFNPANRPQLNSGPPAARLISVRRASTGLPAPLHPGAAKFYREVRWLGVH